MDKKIEPKTLKRIIEVLIAVLAAIAGGIAEATTGLMGSIM